MKEQFPLKISFILLIFLNIIRLFYSKLLNRINNRPSCWHLYLYRVSYLTLDIHSHQLSMGKTAGTSEQLKKPISPFLIFRAEVFDRVKQENSSKKTTQIVDIIQKMWSKLANNDKSKYEQQFKASKTLYDKEKKKPVSSKKKKQQVEPEPEESQEKENGENQDQFEEESAELDQQEDQDYESSSKSKKKNSKSKKGIQQKNKSSKISKTVAKKKPVSKGKSKGGRNK